MKIETMHTPNGNIAIVTANETIVRDVASLQALLHKVRHETGAMRVAIEKRAVSESFFLLSTGLAGKARSSVANAGGKLAIFGDYSRYLSAPERAFFYESNSGKDLFFLPTLTDAIEKLRAA